MLISGRKISHASWTRHKFIIGQHTHTHSHINHSHLRAIRDNQSTSLKVYRKCLCYKQILYVELPVLTVCKMRMRASYKTSAVTTLRQKKNNNSYKSTRTRECSRQNLNHCIWNIHLHAVAHVYVICQSKIQYTHTHISDYIYIVNTRR